MKHRDCFVCDYARLLAMTTFRRLEAPPTPTRKLFLHITGTLIAIGMSLLQTHRDCFIFGSDPFRSPLSSIAKSKRSVALHHESNWKIQTLEGNPFRVKLESVAGYVLRVTGCLFLLNGYGYGYDARFVFR